MKILLLSLVFTLCLAFNKQDYNEKYIIGEWSKLPLISNTVIKFYDNNTVQIFDGTDDKIGNLKNKFTYKVFKNNEEFKLVLYLEKNNKIEDSLLSKLIFHSKDSISITQYKTEKGLFQKPTKFKRKM